MYYDAGALRSGCLKVRESRAVFYKAFIDYVKTKDVDADGGRTRHLNIEEHPANSSEIDNTLAMVSTWTVVEVTAALMLMTTVRAASEHVDLLLHRHRD